MTKDSSGVCLNVDTEQQSLVFCHDFDIHTI